METTGEQPSTPPEQTTPPVIETPKQTEVVAAVEKKPELATTQADSAPVEDNKETSETKSASNILEKFKILSLKNQALGNKIQHQKFHHQEKPILEKNLKISLNLN